MRTSKPNTRLFLLTVFLFITTVKAFSQDYSYINYDTRDGLAGSVVYDAIQDKEGFMWFATENGLSRFDGKNFQTFTTKDGLPDNEILKLFVDSKGRVWIMPFKASLCYYFNGKIYDKTNDTLLAKISLLTYATDMAEDKSGNLFIAEERRWYTILGNRTVRIHEKTDEVVFFVQAIGLNEKDEVEVLTEDSVNKKHYFTIRSDNGNVKMMKTDSVSPENSKCLITPDYVITPSYRGKYLSFYSDGNEAIRAKLPPNTVSINYIDKNKIVINTRNGLRFYDPQLQTFSSQLFADFNFTSAFVDKEHNLWLATNGSGVLMIPSLQFKNFSFSRDKKFAEITALYRYHDTVWAGGWTKEVWGINTNNLRASHVDREVDNVKLVSILPLNNKLFFANTSYTVNPFSHRRHSLPDLSLKSAALGTSGIIVASHANAILIRPSGIQEHIWEGRTTCAIESDSGFYIGTLNGLFHKSYSGKIVNIGAIIPELAARIVNVAVSAQGVLWVTTKGNGIVAYGNNKLLCHFTEKEGLTSDNCISLYVDGNIIWVGTEKGLNRIDISKAVQISHFSMSDGLPSNTINAIVASGHKVFVGTPKGLTYFEVDKISQTSTCDLQLRGIYVVNKYWSYDSTNFSLPHKSNDIRFEFSGISFKSAGEMTYKYRLLGLQPEWRTTTENQLSFPSLSSGEYTLQLVAINKYGVPSQTREVSFVIEKLLWQKTWFKILMAFFIVGVLWTFIVYRIRRIRQQEKKKAEITNRISELEQKALRSQMNPHFIFNCLNSIQQYVAERDITGANNFITDFSRLIRMTLDLSTHSLISLCDELDYITTYLRVEKARLEGMFDYCLNIDQAINLHSVSLPPLLLQPYLENSIRHGIRYKTGSDGLIQINITQKNDGVQIRIQDNGIGREASKKYKSEYHIQYQSRGMTINEDRIKMLNTTSEKIVELTVTDLYNSKEEAAGTRVDIYLPS
jgi:ligand-binding sensor domain-containing protein